MRTKKLLKVIALSAIVFVILSVLFVAAFVFNPFEGNLRDMRDVVPRNVDFFVRKTDLRDDLVRFPEPRFWSDLTGSPVWQQVQKGPAYKAIVAGGIERSLAEAEHAAEGLRQIPFLHPDIVRDLVGTELEVAGRFVPPSLDKTVWCAYMRVGWRVRFAWGLMGYGFAQEQARKAGTQIRVEDDIFVVQPQAGASFYAARHLDCLMIANDKAILQAQSMQLTAGGGEEDSLGTSGFYRDGVENRLREWEKQTGAGTPNALEFYLRPDQLYPQVTWDDNWPNVDHPTDMNERVMGAFINLKGWRFLAGALLFEPRSLSLLAHVDLNRNLHNPFQLEFFKTEAQPNSEWLDPFLGMVPQSVCAAAALRMPAGDFIRKMYDAMDKSWKPLVEDQLKKTGVYTSVGQVIDKLQTALLPRTGFVFRKNVPDPGIKHDSTPMPQIAWVFWIRPEMRSVLVDFVEKFMMKHSQTLGFEGMFTLPSLNKQQGDLIVEFAHGGIPATGEIAILVLKEFFLVSNSGPLIKEMIAAKYGISKERSIMFNDDLQEFRKEMPSAVNGFIYLQGQPMRALLEDYVTAIDRGSGVMDPEWAAQSRDQAKASVFKEKYASRFASQDSLEKSKEREAFSRDIDARLGEMWRKQAGSFNAADKDRLYQAMAFADLLRSAYVQVILDPQTIKTSGRAKFNYEQRTPERGGN